MHDELPLFIGECKKRGIYTVIASNLIVATPRKIDAAFDAGLDFLVMDVDSLDPDRYAKMRVNGKLDILRDRVVHILRRPLGQRPYTVAQTIMLDGKPEYELSDLVKWTGGLLPEELRYKFLDSFRGEIVDSVKGALRPEEVCREPFYGFTVHVNGNVVPCDRDWAGESVMGNVFEQTAIEIWNGEKYKEFRRQMKSDIKPVICQTCPEGRLINMRSQPHIQVNMFKGKEVHHQ
jgi:radical SAM protein with 4Fe4S-binding SPASM domain